MGSPSCIGLAIGAVQGNARTQRFYGDTGNRGRPNADTEFEIGSITKTFTAKADDAAHIIVAASRILRGSACMTVGESRPLSRRAKTRPDANIFQSAKRTPILCRGTGNC
jgi:hypothetical protein